jgi:hypothetical protein
MEEKIIKDYGWCTVFEINNVHFIRFDEGGVAVNMRTYKITREQAEEVAKSEELAEKLAFEVQKKPPTT